MDGDFLAAGLYHISQYWLLRCSFHVADITSMKYILVSSRIFHVSDVCAYLCKGLDSKNMYILFYLQYALASHLVVFVIYVAYISHIFCGWMLITFSTG
jgi:hypothetical protein